jgi:hypothetical protein
MAWFDDTTMILGCQKEMKQKGRSPGIKPEQAAFQE